MRLPLALAALLLPCAALAQSFPGRMPPNTIVCNNTGTSVNPLICKYITTAVTSTGAGSGWYLNDSPPAAISKFGDRVFIGDAVKYLATSPQSAANGNDWYSQFTCGGIYGACGAQIGSSTLMVEASLTNKFGTTAITGAASSLPCLGVNCGVIGVNGIAVNNVAATGGHTYANWGSYYECNNIVNNTGSCTGAEIDIAVAFDRDALFGTIPANNPFQQGGNNAIQSQCATAFSGFVCDTWLSLQGSSGGPNKFVTGINFMNNTVAPNRGPTMPGTGANATVAIALPEAYDIVWYHDVNTITGAVFTGSSGNLNFSTNGTLVVNGTTGVSCGAGTVNAATMVVTNGLVTHC
jgi:hypothetical protein